MEFFNISDQIHGHERQKVRVDVFMLRTNWIFREINSESKGMENTNEFLNLIDTLDNVEDKSLFTTEFVEALIQQFWSLYIKVFNFVFVPFIIQTISCVIYFSQLIFIPPEETTGVTTWVIKATVIITTIYFAYLECIQIK